MMSPMGFKRPLAVLTVVLSAAMLSACGGAQARKVKHLEKGHTYLDAGNYEKARVEFQNALQIAPTDPEARFENGVVDEKLNKGREAAQFYQATIDVSPDHLGAHTNLARLYLFAGAPDKTMELLKPALEKHPDDSELLTLRAAANVQKKLMPEAQADAERAVQLSPGNEDAVSALAGIYVSDKSPERAQALLEGAIKLIPGSVALRMSLAQVYVSENRLDDAERMLTQIIGLQPKERGNRIRLAQFYTRQKQIDAAEKTLRDGIKTMPDDRDLKLSLVDFLATHRSTEAAESELLSMIGAAPKDVDLKFSLAKFYVAKHQAERAEKVYQGVIDAENLNAAGVAARDGLAGLRAQRNDMKGTEELIGQVLAKSPRDNEALILRADIELTKRDPKAAIADLRTVLRDQPNSVPVLRTLARAHLANGEPAIAEETLRTALEGNPKNAELRLDFAQFLAQTGKPEQAKTVLADLVKDQPNDVQALDSLFRISVTAKDYDTAKSAAAAMVAAQPESPIGFMYQGILAEQAKKTDDALGLYRQAQALQPDALEPLQAQIRLLASAKRVPEAMKRLDDLTAQDPKNSFAPNIKGELFLMQKDYANAQTAFKVAITRAPAWWAPYRGLAAAQFASQESDAGLATLRSAQSAVNQPEQVGVEIASYYERAGKPEEAMKEYDSIVQRDPQSDVAANNLAMLLVTYGKDAASLDRAKSLVARFADSANPSYLDTYGWVLYKHGDAAASVPVLQRAASQVPGAPVVLYHLGMAQSQSGNTAQALDNLTRAVNSGTKFSGLDEARATLDKLNKPLPAANAKT